MARERCMWDWQLLIFSVFIMFLVHIDVTNADGQEYCSFFNNRAPKAQPGLKNCTWYKDNSCCMQQEIEATFGRVKPLKGASTACQKYINYLMCYICAPNQNIFYKRERLTVCETFCDVLYDACGSAILKGSVIRDLYSSGSEFCLSRRFEVSTEGCFKFDVSLDTNSAQPERSNIFVILIMVCMCYLTQRMSMPCDWPNLLTVPQNIADNYKRNNKTQKNSSRRNLPNNVNKIKSSQNTLRDQRQVSQLRKKSHQGNCRLCWRQPPWIDSAIIAIVLCIFHLPQGTGALSTDDIKTWTAMLSADLTELAKKGLRYEEIQQLYDRAKYATEYVNGTEKILQVRAKLDNFFTKKKELAVELAHVVTKLHDDWLREKLEKRKHQPDEEYDEYGTYSFREGKVVSDASDDGTDEEPYDGPRLDELSLDVYKDSDLPHRMPPKLLNYDKDFGQMIMDGYSAVKIGDDLDRNSEEIVDTVRWTAKLDKAFNHNRVADPTIRWQYFGSSTGVHRMFPGHPWQSNFIGFPEDYDPRTRPWYVSATSGPKDVVILLDGSTSMTQHGSFDRLKSVALKILSSLTKNDRVNVVVSRSPYWDKEGVYHHKTAEVLGCYKHGLISASPAHSKELASDIHSLQPDGGSDHVDAFNLAFTLLRNSTSGDCQSLLIFITDGQEYDLNQRCSPGYYKYNTENQKEFVAGDLCDYDFDNVIHIVNILQYQVPRRAQLFTFLTYNKDSSPMLPGRLACYNQGAMAKVTSDSDISHQMAPYFRFLESSSGTRDPIWTSPYLDKAGLGLMVTFALPVYSNITKRQLGVVGVDSPLAQLETIMHHSLWGNAYTFMIDSRDGSTIIHPFSKPSAQLVNDPAFIPVTSLETHQGQPQEFQHVLNAMLKQQTGDFKVTKNATRVISVHNSLIWRPTQYSHYFYTDIPDSDYAIAFNLAKTDETFQHARDPMVTEPITYLHEMESYKMLGEDFHGVFEDLGPSDKYLAYPGLLVTKHHSVVKLAPRCFCDPTEYLEAGKPNNAEIHKYINIFTPTYDIHCPRGTFRRDVRPDVKLTGQLESLWMSRPASLQNQILWTYVGTMGGVMRIYPGVQMTKDFDPTKRPWYHRSVGNRGKLALSSVYQDSQPSMGKVVTFTWAIHKAKPLTPPDCTGDARDYGCPCDQNYECKSEYCYQKSCADDLIQGVVALDLRYHDFQTRVVELIQSSDVRRYCTLRYNCPDGEACETRCYLLDDTGALVMSAEFLFISDVERSAYEEVSLAIKEGYIFSELIRQGVYLRNTRVQYQGVCSYSQNIPLSKADQQWLPDQVEYHYQHVSGPIPAFKNQYGCIQEVVFYTLNKTFSRNDSYIIRGNLSGSACSSGSYYFTPVPGTNLHFLVIEDYRNIDTPTNFNCRIENRVHAPGSYKVTQGACDEDDLPSVDHHPRTCPNIKTVPVPCGYSSAYSPTAATPSIISIATILLLTHYILDKYHLSAIGLATSFISLNKNSVS